MDEAEQVIKQHPVFAENWDDYVSYKNFMKKAKDLIEDAKRLDFIEDQAITVYCNYVSGPEAYTALVHDGEGGTVLPDEVFYGYTIREAIDKARDFLS